MLHYIIQTLLFQTLFLAIYDLFLKKETFFQWNRAYLMLSSILAYIIPFIKIESATNYVQQNIGQLPEVVLNPEMIFLNEVNLTTKNTSLFTLENFYFLGIGIATILFMYKIGLLFLKIYKNTMIKKQSYNLVILPKQQTAFSFFKYLFLGKKLYENEHKHIIKHELIHIKQKHSIDLIYFELQKIVFWFNPFSYLFQQRISALHEYIADEKTLKTESKQSFFENLLTQTFQVEKFAFVNQFYKKSLIKKRIAMITKNKSKEILKLKYLLIIPLMFVMVGFTSLMKSTKQTATTTVQNSEVKLTSQKTKSAFIKNDVKQVLDTITPTKSNSILKEEEIIEDVPFSTIDEVPVYPGCETANNKKKCMSDKISEYVVKEFNVDIAQNLGLKAGKKRITTQFKIDNHGNVSNIRVRAPHPKLQEEVIRVIKGLPKMKPGKKRGKAVNVRYNLPIVFKVEDDVDAPPIPPKVPQPIRFSKEFDDVISEDVPFSVIDEVPVYPGCETANNKKKCMSDKITKYVAKEFNVDLAQDLGLSAGKKRISVQFKIDNHGNVSDVRARAPHPKLQEEAIRVLKGLPKMKPGKQNGRAVNVRYNLPIVFKVEGDEQLSKKPIDANRLITVLDHTEKTFPVYPTCENVTDPKKCSATKLVKFINQNFNKEKVRNLGLKSGWKRIQVSFFVKDNGKVEVTKINSPHKKIDEEVMRVFNSIPKMKPALKDNKPANSKLMIIPIVFNLD